MRALFNGFALQQHRLRRKLCCVCDLHDGSYSNERWFACETPFRQDSAVYYLLFPACVRVEYVLASLDNSLLLFAFIYPWIALPWNAGFLAVSLFRAMLGD